jgi:hypothetical protein
MQNKANIQRWREVLAMCFLTREDGTIIAAASAPNNWIFHFLPTSFASLMMITPEIFFEIVTSVITHDIPKPSSHVAYLPSDALSTYILYCQCHFIFLSGLHIKVACKIKHNSMLLLMDDALKPFIKHTKPHALSESKHSHYKPYAVIQL